MDRAAELTLQIACFLQASDEAPSSPREWLLIPGPRVDGFAGTTARLAALTKPVVVGALDHPGYVAVWRADGLDDAERGQVAHTLRNQQANLAHGLARLNAGDDALVVFEGWGTRVEVTVAELRRWMGEYALTWGWTIGAPTDASHAARLFVTKGGHTLSPGRTCGVRPP